MCSGLTFLYCKYIILHIIFIVSYIGNFVSLKHDEQHKIILHCALVHNCIAARLTYYPPIHPNSQTQRIIEGIKINTAALDEHIIAPMCVHVYG